MYYWLIKKIVTANAEKAKNVKHQNIIGKMDFLRASKRTRIKEIVRISETFFVKCVGAVFLVSLIYGFRYLQMSIAL